MNTLTLTSQLTTKLETLQNQLRMRKDSLVSHNYIVQVGAYTVEKNNETNNMELTLKILPSQWTEEGVQEIQEKANYTNSKGNVTPVVFSVNDWYNKEINSLENTIKTISLF